MKLSITIEIDDRAPDVEYCGENCKFLNRGICHLFNEKLNNDSLNKADESGDGTIVYEKTATILGWKRHRRCIEVFYGFGDSEIQEEDV